MKTGCGETHGVKAKKPGVGPRTASEHVLNVTALQDLARLQGVPVSNRAVSAKAGAIS